MSNDVQSHEAVAERVSGGERRGGLRHGARALGSVTARIIGGSHVDLVNFSSRGVLFECDSRLLIGARASVRITTTDANIIVTGRVVRSRVKGLVNGALRYDAALVLDTELALAPAIDDAEPAASDDLVSESDFEAPSPVEAYLAESEASLLEVASGTDLPLNGALVEAAVVAAEPTPAEATPFVAEVADAVVADEPVACDTAPAVVDAEPVAFEPVAFEVDGDVAFEPAVEFAFDELAEAPFEASAESDLAFTASVDPSHDVLVAERIVVEEPAGVSMFDATYIPPSGEAEASPESLFEVTPPMPAPELSASSLFDARPSENYGDAPEAPGVAGRPVEADSLDLPASLDDAAALDVAGDVEIAAGAADGIDFESEVTFEAEDAVMFEASFEASFDDAPADAPVDVPAEVPVELATAPPAEPLADASAPPPADASAPADDLPAFGAADAAAIEVASDDDIEPSAPVPGTDDRVLLQFAATVPHDLAELRRIAADNQW